MVAGFRRLGDRDLAVGVKGAVAAGRRDHDRAVVFGAEDLGAHVDLADIDQPARPQLEFPETLAIGAQGHFVVDAGGHVAEMRRRHVLLHDRFEVENVERLVGSAISLSRSRGAQSTGSDGRNPSARALLREQRARRQKLQKAAAAGELTVDAATSVSPLWKEILVSILRGATRCIATCGLYDLSHRGRHSAIPARLAMMSLPKSANADWLRQPGWKNMSGHVKLANISASLSSLAARAPMPQQQVIGAPPEASNMKLVGSQRPAGAQRLSADHPSSGRPLDRLYRSSRRHRRHSGAGQSADRQGRAERHLDRRRHRSRASEISAPHSRAGGKI